MTVYSDHKAKIKIKGDTIPMLGEADICILSHNRKDLLKNCIDSIEKNTYYPYNLILMDNGSEKETQTFIQNKRCATLRSNENIGFAKGFNVALEMSRSKFKVILNNDTIVEPHWLERIIKVFDEHPKAGLVSPYTTFACNRNIISSKQKYMNTKTKQIKGDIPAVCWAITDEVYERVTKVMKKLGAESSSFFHSDFQYAAGEDIVTSKAIDNLGYEKYVAGQSFIYHIGHGTLKDLWEEAEEAHKKNKELKNKYLKLIENVCKGV